MARERCVYIVCQDPCIFNKCDQQMYCILFRVWSECCCGTGLA